MGDQRWLADEFEQQRPRLRAVARRMLGTGGQADDAVQEAWLRLSRSDAAGIDNLAGWLTTVVGRICLDLIRTRTSRPESAWELGDHDCVDEAAVDPEEQALGAQFVGMALQVVLDTLDPAERSAFVLHDLFAVPYDQIAPLVNRSVTATRQLASRGRRKVQGASAEDVEVHRRLVDAFLDAARHGHFERLLRLLDPDVVLRADQVGVDASAAAAGHGAPLLAAEVRGADAVARAFSGRAATARPARIGGQLGFAWAPEGRPRAVYLVTVHQGRIVELDLYADPVTLAEFDVVLL